jgi:hypothetical protein
MRNANVLISGVFLDYPLAGITEYFGICHIVARHGQVCLCGAKAAYRCI